MKKETFKENLKLHQVSLLKDGFFCAHCGRQLRIRNREKSYEHIIDKGSEEQNLFPKIREKVNTYFHDNKISFWGGETITPNTLSSQVSCLNHLFFIRDKHDAVRNVMQHFVGDRLKIASMERVSSKTETAHCQYIAFEMISDENRMNERKLTRGNTCTSIDAFAIAIDLDGKRHILVIEWKLVEDDSGNKAPDPKTSKNIQEIERGNSRIENYGELIRNSKFIKSIDGDYHNSSLFNLPFYELMRQTLWAELNKIDFAADDYIHIHVVPSGNNMRHKYYRSSGIIKGIEESWKSHLTDEGKKRYMLVDPHSVIDAIRNYPEYQELTVYLEKRYYSF